MLTLHIGNKNYSSWSLRPWVLLRAHGIAFTEVLHRFGRDNLNDGFRAFSPTAKVPCLIDDALVVWDSLAIAEYLAERYPGIWPEDPEARARSEEHTSELQSLMRISYDVFCLKKKTIIHYTRESKLTR